MGAEAEAVVSLGPIDIGRVFTCSRIDTSDDDRFSFLRIASADVTHVFPDND